MGKKQLRGKLGAIAGASLALVLGTAAAAVADTSDYHPTQESRDFATSAGGWAGSETYATVVCVTGVTCPAVTSDHEAAGGAGGVGDGFLRSRVTALTSLLTTTTITWESPTFSYNGANGAAPDSVSFSMDRRVNAGALLAVLSDADYSVLLVDQTKSLSRSLCK